jgi:hypothetical protein
MDDKHLIIALRKALSVALALMVTCPTTLIVTALIGLALRGGFDPENFFRIWSWARFEIEHPAALIYGHAARQAFPSSPVPIFPLRMPFPYPPFYLLLIRPLGWLSHSVAWALWSAATLLAYIVAVCSPAWRLRIVLPALLAPATAMNLVYGQNGFLTAALLVGGIRLAPSWPVAAGVLLGLLAYKPQFGLLVVIALVAAGLWRTALAAAFTVVVAVAASLFAFGPEAWAAWANSMPDFVAYLDLHRAAVLPLMPTALANALVFGASDRLAQGIQFAATAASAAAVWFAFRDAPSSFSAPGASHGWGTAGRAAVLATASILASPYAFVYDMTLVAAAVAFIVAEYWSTLSVVEVFVLGVAALLPAGMLMHVIPPVSAAVHGLLLALILLRYRAAYSTDAGHPFQAIVSNHSTALWVGHAIASSQQGSSTTESLNSVPGVVQWDDPASGNAARDFVHFCRESGHGR